MDFDEYFATWLVGRSPRAPQREPVRARRGLPERSDPAVSRGECVRLR